MLFKNHREIPEAELKGVIARADVFSKAILEEAADRLFFPTNLENLKEALLNVTASRIDLTFFKRHYLLKHKIYVIEGDNPKFYFEAILMLGQTSRVYKITDSYKEHVKRVNAWLKPRVILDHHASSYHESTLPALADLVKNKVDILSCDTPTFLNTIVLLFEKRNSAVYHRVNSDLINAIFFFREEALLEADKKALLAVREREGQYYLFYKEGENETELNRVSLDTVYDLLKEAFTIKNNESHDFLSLFRLFVNERYRHLGQKLHRSFFEFYKEALINSLVRAVQNGGLNLIGDVCLRFLIMSEMVSVIDYPVFVEYLEQPERKLAFVAYLIGVAKALDSSPRPLDQVEDMLLTLWFTGTALERVKELCFEMVKGHLTENPEANLAGNSRINRLFNLSTEVEPVKNETKNDYSEMLSAVLRRLGRAPVALGDWDAMAAHAEQKLKNQFERFKEFKTLTLQEKRGRFLALLKKEALDDAKFVLTQKWFDINYGCVQAVRSDEAMDDCLSPVLLGVMQDKTLGEKTLDNIYDFMFKRGVDLFLSIRARGPAETAVFTCKNISLVEWAKINHNYFYDYVIKFISDGRFESYMKQHHKVLVVETVEEYNYTTSKIEEAYGTFLRELISTGLSAYFKGEAPPRTAALQPFTAITYAYQHRTSDNKTLKMAMPVFKREFLTVISEENELISFLFNWRLSGIYNVGICWLSKYDLLNHMKSVLLASLKSNEPDGFPAFHHMCLAYQLLRMGRESRKLKADTKSFSEFKAYYLAMTAVTHEDFTRIPVVSLYQRIREHLTEGVVEYLLKENKLLFSNLDYNFFETRPNLGKEYGYSLLSFMIFYHTNAERFKQKQSRSYSNCDWIEALYQAILKKLNGPWYEAQLNDLPDSDVKRHAKHWYDAVCQFENRWYPIGAMIDSIVLGSEQQEVLPSPFFVVLFVLRNLKEPLLGLRDQQMFETLLLSVQVESKAVTLLLSVFSSDEVKALKEEIGKTLKAYKTSKSPEDQTAKAKIKSMQEKSECCLAFQLLQYGRRSQKIHPETKSYQQFMLFGEESLPLNHPPKNANVDETLSRIQLRPSPYDDAL